MSEYSSSNIQVLEGLDPVRKRPGMYIGTTSKKGLHHLIWEILDNSIDEAMAGHANEVYITITKDGSVVVEDNGRGIPTDIHPKTKLSTVETVLTTLHAGGKFDASSYKVSGGLHGVGASVVNALSSRLEVWVKRDGQIFYQEYLDGGNPQKPLAVVGSTEDTGTKIKFKPDFQIMEKNNFDYEIIEDRVRQTAYLNKGLKLVVVDEKANKNVEFCFEGGIKEFVAELNSEANHIHEEIVYSEGEINGTEGPVIAEVAFQYTETYQPKVVSYANNIATNEGGTHEWGFYDALVRILNNYAGENRYFKTEKDKLSKEDIKEGLTAIVSIKHVEPIFEGQTKGKLANKDARQATNKVISSAFERFLAENPQDARAIIEKCLRTQKGRLAAQSARENITRKSIFEAGTLPGKLADCASKNSEISELYIVEGDSAGGSAKLGRDREIQAILPLRGKVINSEKASVDKVFQNEEINSLISAIGTDIFERFNINKLRYHKIIIMTDADVDGSHIRTLLLTFFYRFLRPLIEYGFVYIAQPPLYKTVVDRHINYFYIESEKDEYLKSLPEGKKIDIQRYKGLGEMDAEQLWETTMDPEARKMFQVQIEDAAIADRVFSMLMGENVEQRRNFINENAKYAEIDV